MKKAFLAVFSSCLAIALAGCAFSGGPGASSSEQISNSSSGAENSANASSNDVFSSSDSGEASSSSEFSSAQSSSKQPSSESSSSADSSSTPASSYPSLDWEHSYSSYKNGNYTNYIDYADASSFRLAEPTSSYGVSYVYAPENGSSSFKIVGALYEDTYYVEPGEVCHYYEAFGHFPLNYVMYDAGEDNLTDGALSQSKAASKAVADYGEYGRLYTAYCRSSGYANDLPKFNGSSYYEIDIDDGSGRYNDGEDISRGGGRIVIPVGGIVGYSSEIASFVTYDHYNTFREYANYFGGWGQNFNGEGSRFSSYTALETVKG